MNLSLPPLPYALTALEPHISSRTLEVHHGRHHLAYVEKARKLVEGTALQSASLEEIVRASATSDRGLFNAAAQAWNHTFYWSSMSPDGGGEAQGEISNLIERTFGSQSAFRQEFAAAATGLFGSGWVWLVLDGQDQDEPRLRIVSTNNADTPLVTRQVPLLVIDVWEHAYYLDHQQRRGDYVQAFISYLVNWEFANRNLATALDVDATVVMPA